MPEEDNLRTLSRSYAKLVEGLLEVKDADICLRGQAAEEVLERDEVDSAAGVVVWVHSWLMPWEKS